MKQSDDHACRLPGTGTWQLDEFSRFFGLHPLPTWVFHLDSLAILDVNQAAVERYGYSRDEFLQMTLYDLRPASEAEQLDLALARRRERRHGGFQQTSSAFHCTREGEHIHANVMTYPYSEQDPELVIATVMDMSNVHDLEIDLHRQTAYFRQLFENSPDGIAILDTEDNIIEINCAFARMFGHDLDECQGMNINALVANPEDRDSANLLSRDARDSIRRADSILRRRKDGTTLRVDILGYPIATENGTEGIYAIYRDVSDKYDAQKELEFRALHDPLTSLLNRREMESRVMRLLSTVPRSAKSHAFIYIDLDEFKFVNDTSGHIAGDQLLIAVSSVLKLSVKGHDVVARLGGDEFGILLYDCNLENATLVAERILKSVRGLHAPGANVSNLIGASIGVAAVHAGVDDFEHLLSNADAACYAAKASGKNRVEVYEHSKEKIIERRELGTWAIKLRNAIDQHHFELHRQAIEPIRRTEPKRNYEVLVRLRSRKGELISPGCFIPAAERLNLMEEIDDWVVRRVLEELANTPGDDIYSINISGNSLGKPEFVEGIARSVRESGVPGNRLCFEITETSAISRMDVATHFIYSMRELGCELALDDFGSGMSSFSYLKLLPVDILKIDGSFIQDIVNSERDQAITESFNRIGHAFGMATVAEFVEDEETVRLLESLGVDYAQGFHIHRPEPWIVSCTRSAEEQEQVVIDQQGEEDTHQVGD